MAGGSLARRTRFDTTPAEKSFSLSGAAAGGGVRPRMNGIYAGPIGVGSRSLNRAAARAWRPIVPGGWVGPERAGPAGGRARLAAGQVRRKEQVHQQHAHQDARRRACEHRAQQPCPCPPGIPRHVSAGPP